MGRSRSDLAPFTPRDPRREGCCLTQSGSIGERQETDIGAAPARMLELRTLPAAGGAKRAHYIIL